MTTDYRLKKKVRLADLIDGRLEKFGVHEQVVPGETSDKAKCLTDGNDHVWAYADGDGCVESLTRYGGTGSILAAKGRPVKSPTKYASVHTILEAIEKAFDTDIFSEIELEYWGYEQAIANWIGSIRNEEPDIGRAAAYARGHKPGNARASDPALRGARDRRKAGHQGSRAGESQAQVLARSVAARKLMTSVSRGRDPVSSQFGSQG